MKKILILGVAAVQYDVIKYLKTNYSNIEVHAIAMKNDGPGSKIADYFTEINILDIEGVKSYVQINKIDFIYSVGSDISMPVIGKVSEELGLPHFISRLVLCEQVSQMRRADCVEVRLIENAGMHYFLSLKKNHQDVWY